MSGPEKQIAHQETMCCGYKRCPEVTLYTDGSLELLDEGQRILMNPEQAARLRELLATSPCANRER